MRTPVLMRLSTLGLALLAVTALAAIAELALADEHGAKFPRPIWSLQLPEGLRGRLYQVVIQSGERPTALATSPEAVVELSNEVRVVLPLARREGAEGDSAIIPSIAARGAVRRIGILVHDHHAIARFRLVDMNGKTQVELDDPRHFHYRLSPAGKGFVGIDSGGKHAAGTAKRFVYRFYDERGKLRAEVPSLSPGGQDSAYTPDGAAFIVNSGAEGVTAYSAGDGKRLWNLYGRIKYFAAASGASGRVLVSSADDRSKARLHQRGKRLWTHDLGPGDEGQNVRNVAISPSGEVAVVTGSTLVQILGDKDAKLTGEHRIDDSLVINSLAVSDRGLVALGAQSANAESASAAKGRVIVLDRRGKVLIAEDVRQARPNAWTPTVQFDASGRLLLVRNLEQIALYPLNAGSMDEDPTKTPEKKR